MKEPNSKINYIYIRVCVYTFDYMERCFDTEIVKRKTAPQPH